MPYWILYAFSAMLASLNIIRLSESTNRIRPITAIVFIMCISLFAGLRAPFVDADMINYLNWFSWLDHNYESDPSSARDPIFSITALLFYRTGLPIAIFFTSAALLSLLLKYKLISLLNLRDFIYLFLYLYVCRFFFLHEMTQLRAGIGISLASVAIVIIFGKRYFSGLLLFLVSIGIHLISILMVPIIFVYFYDREFKKRWPVLLIIFSSLFFYFQANFLLGFFNLYDFSRTSSYLDGSYKVERNTLVSVYFIVKTLIFGWMLFQWEKTDRGARLCMYLVAMGVFYQISFLSMDVFSLRASEVFGLFDIALFVYAIRGVPSFYKPAYLVFLVITGAVFFISSLQIMNPYHVGVFY